MAPASQAETGLGGCYIREELSLLAESALNKKEEGPYSEPDTTPGVVGGANRSLAGTGKASRGRTVALGSGGSEG